MKQLPSPLYGGDYYFSMGAINHIKYGGNPLLNNNVLSIAPPVYFPLYSLLVNVFKWLDTFTAMKVVSFLVSIASLFVVYQLMYSIFKKQDIALFGVLVYLPLTTFPIWKYLQFSQALMYPLFIYAAYTWYTERSSFNCVFFGAMFGLLAISHSVAFVAGCIFFSILTIITFLKDDNKLLFVTNIGIILAIAIPISMLYWAVPLFVFKLQILNPITAYVQWDVSTFALQAKFIGTVIKQYVYRDVYTIFRAILFVIGIFLFTKMDKSQKEWKFIHLYLISTVIALLHFVITEPILHTNFSPMYLGMFMIPLAIAILAPITVSLLEKPSLICLILVGMVVVNGIQFMQYYTEDRYMQTGRSEWLPQLAMYPEAADWIIKNTDVNDVFLSNNELSFVIHSFTGRKIMSNRRSHNSLFVDVDRLQLDMAILLYGNDSAKQKSIKERYGIDYLYWDVYWPELDYYNKGQPFDPIVVLDNEYNRRMLSMFNVTYLPVTTWIDPSTKFDGVRQYPILYVLYKLNATPWTNGLNKLMVEVWNYQNVAKIYKFEDTEFVGNDTIQYNIPVKYDGTIYGNSSSI